MAASRQYNPKRQSPQRNTKKRRSGASPSSRGNAAIPGWLWLVAGLGVGILVTSLWKLTDADPAAAPTGREQRAQQQQAARTQQQRPAKPAAPAKTETKPAAKPAEQAGTRFDFYTLLPEREVLVPNERELSAPTSAAPATAAPATATPAAATAQAAVPVYLLQAGSFRAPAEADRRRAQILLLGLEARVETVNANGDTWYRVHAGPFQAGDKLTQARALLSGEGIETLPLKQKPAG